MAYTANTWVSPIDIKSTDKVIDTATNLQNIVSDSSSSIKNYLNGEMSVIEGIINTNSNDIQVIKEINGSVTLSRFDKRLSSLDIQSMEYTNDTLTSVIYYGDDNSTIYYRDIMGRNTSGTLVTVSHFYGTSDLTTASGTTTLTYDANNLLVNVTYTEG